MTALTPSEQEQPFGPYFGSSLTFNDCEVLAIQNIDHKLRGKESRLYSMKWFDCRQMHPTQATYLLAHLYSRAYADFMSTCADRGLRFMAGFKGKDFFLSRERKSFWRLRQRIDELGIPYDFFLRAAMNWHIAAGWKQPPRPAHISSNDEMTLEITNLWELECRAKLPFAASLRYTAENFVGAPDQIEYEETLTTRIMQRPVPKYALHAALYVYGALRIETALRQCSSEAVCDAVHYCLLE